jgi:phosphonopyruvate decarboxylase
MTAMSLAEAVEGLVAARASAPEETVGVLTMSAMALWPPGPANYRLLGLMGGAASIGLGIAVGRPDLPVWVVDGDGSLLMQLGVLSAVADAAPANLTHVLVDNGVYAVSGAQPTPHVRDWEGLFVAAGYASAVTCRTRDGLAEAFGDQGRRPAPGPRAVIVACAPGRPAYPPGSFAPRPDEARRFKGFLAGVG